MADPTLGDAATLDAAYHLSTYRRNDVLFVRGEGMRLYDSTGREYLDFLAGIGVVNLGHAHSGVAAAVCEQMGTLVHVSNLFHVKHRAELAQCLSELAGGGWRAFFCNSGTESIEGAIKLARRWGTARRGPTCNRIVAAERSFHGRTLGALAATGQVSKQEAFEPLPGGFMHVPLNDIAALENAVDETTCAVLLEPIQGEAGVYPCDDEYLAAARRLCDERDVLLILDEVQTGMFRTGTPFAWQGYGVRPDVMTLAKGLANGLPAGAVLACGSAAGALQPGDHGSTFGGGPVIAVAALATIDGLVAGDLGENAMVVGEQLRSDLRMLAARDGRITDVRGRGLMTGIDLAAPVAKPAVASLLEHGIIANATGDATLRFLPPLVCSHDESAILLDTIETVIGVH